MSFKLEKKDQTYWDQKIQAYRDSNLSLEKWCLENEIPLGTMRYHIYYKKELGHNYQPQLVEVTLKDSSVCSSSIIKLGKLEISINQDNIDIVSQLIKKVIYD